MESDYWGDGYLVRRGLVPADVDGRHPLHQDLLYFPFRPADSIVGV